MAKAIQYGCEEIIEMMNRVGAGAEAVAKAGLYKGAGVMADKLANAAKSIVTEKFKYAPPGSTRYPSPEEKAAVMAGMIGIAKFNGTGTEVNTAVGMRDAGYAEIAGKTKPIPLIANSIESGTSFMKKQPVFRKAANSAKGAVIEAMKQGAEEKLQSLIKGV